MSKREAEISSVESSSKKRKTQLSIDEVKIETVKLLTEQLTKYFENNDEKKVKKTAQMG